MHSPMHQDPMRWIAQALLGDDSLQVPFDLLDVLWIGMAIALVAGLAVSIAAVGRLLGHGERNR